MMHAMTSQETNARAGFAMPEDFFPSCLTNENIHYDVDENLWPNPQDRVDKNIKCSEEHSSLHFTVGLM